MICELMLAFDHLKHEVTMIAYAFADDGADAAFERAVATIDEAREALRGPVPPPRPRPERAGSAPPPDSFTPEGVEGPGSRT